MSNWAHENKLNILLETTTHDRKYFENIHGTPLLKLKQDVNIQHAQLAEHHNVSDIRDYAKVTRTLHPYTKHSRNINSTLIYKKASLIKGIVYKHQAKNISDVIGHHGKPLDADVHVYSGTGHFNPGRHLKAGGILHTPAFTSTSLHPAIAYNFMENHHGEAHVIHFHLPKGYNKSFYIGKHTAHRENEYELLLDKDQHWKLTGHEIVHNPHNELHHTVHVWSVTPHDKNINEMTYHDHEEVSKAINKPLKSNKRIMDVRDQFNRLADHIESIPLKNHHIESIRDYTDSSTSLNSALINNEDMTSDDKTLHKNLQKTFKRHDGLPEEVHVYSGLGDWDPTNQFKHGKIHTPSYISTSLDPAHAHGFANRGGGDEHIIHFHLPKGHKDAVFAAPFSYSPQEHEVILNHNQHWKLTNHNVVTRYNKISDSNVKVHIWSVKPAKNIVTEALTHSHHYFTKPPREGYSATTSNYTQATLKSKALRKDINYKLSNEILSQHESLKGGDKPEKHILDSARYYSRSDGSRNINGHLIEQHSNERIWGYSGGSAEVSLHIKNLKDYIAGAKPLEQEGHFYSGTGSWKPNVKEGDILHTPAFTSTSINPHIAHHGFSDSLGHIIHFHLPKGYKNGRYIAEHTANSAAEQEYLLNSDQKWKVLKITRAANKQGAFDSHRTIIHVIPHDEHVTETYFHSKHFFSSSPVIKSDKASTKRKHAEGIRRKLGMQQFNDALKHYEDLLSSDVSSDYMYLHHDDSAKYYSRTHGARTINQHLIQKYTNKSSIENPVRDQHISNLKDYIKSGPTLPKEGHFYSGTGYWKPDVKVGGILHTPAFTSTSSDPLIAKDFMRTSEEGGQHVIHFHLPKGYSRGRHIANHAYNSRIEREYLLDSDQKWKVTNIQRVKGIGINKRTIISVIPHDESSDK